MLPYLIIFSDSVRHQQVTTKLNKDNSYKDTRPQNGKTEEYNLAMHYLMGYLIATKGLPTSAESYLLVIRHHWSFGHHTQRTRQHCICSDPRCTQSRSSVLQNLPGHQLEAKNCAEKLLLSSTNQPIDNLVKHLNRLKHEQKLPNMDPEMTQTMLLFDYADTPHLPSISDYVHQVCGPIS